MDGLESLQNLNLEGNPIISIDEFMFGSAPINNDISIWLGCHSMPCFTDLCWINEKIELPDIAWCDPRCNNYDINVRQYLEDEC